MAEPAREPAPSRDDTTGESEAKTLERRLPPGLAAELAARYTAEPPAAGAALIWDELSSSELLDVEQTSTTGPREREPPSSPLSERTRPIGRKR